MTDSYREEINKYKAKKIGQTDAKVIAPKGKKKKVSKPWSVTTEWNNDTPFKWKPHTTHFEKEHDARAYLRKMQLSTHRTSWLTHNGVKET